MKLADRILKQQEIDVKRTGSTPNQQPAPPEPQGITQGELNVNPTGLTTSNRPNQPEIQRTGRAVPRARV